MQSHAEASLIECYFGTTVRGMKEYKETAGLGVRSSSLSDSPAFYPACPGGPASVETALQPGISNKYTEYSMLLTTTVST